MKRLLAALSIVLVAGCAPSALPAPTSVTTTKPAPSIIQPASTPVTADRAASWPTPIAKYTPGGLAKVCERKVTAATEAEVNMLYGVKHGQTVNEYDHLVPVFVCGSNGPDNIWPQMSDGYNPGGFFHNRKDQLEIWASNQLRHHGWTSAMVVALFRFPADWRKSWCRFLGAAHPEVDCQGV